MAEEEAAAAKGGLGALKTKIGPLPLGIWLAAGGVIFWYVSKKKSTGQQAGTQTDPAGNTGAIDPATGYVYGTPQDQAGLSSQSAGGGTGTAPGSTGGSTVAGQYSDNNAWAQAAINYLVSIGIDPTAANSAIQQFLASQTLAPDQQADVNLAIQRIGAPPQPPQPGTAPQPIVQPPSPGTVYATNPPTGLAVSDTSANSISLKWNKATNAAGYTINWGTTPAASDGTATIAGTAVNYTATGLRSGTLYYVQVQATPAKQGDPYASLTQSTAKATSTGGGGGSTGGPKTQQYTTVTVVKWTRQNTPWNSTLSGIADHYHVPGGYKTLQKLNGIRDANHIEPGQKIKVPVS